MDRAHHADSGGDSNGDFPHEATASAAIGYARFIESCRDSATEFRLTTRAEPTAFARCFALFGMRLLLEEDRFKDSINAWVAALKADLDRYRQLRAAAGEVLKFDKFYLQLLTFSLSALSILGRSAAEPCEDHVLPLLSTDVRGDLERLGALEGRARSGNLAMFMAILLLHARDVLGVPTSARVDEWVDLHMRHMNGHGFWGPSGMTHLQFQNGYHQYEILEYLHVPEVPWERAARSVALLADRAGHFAPYPGGGGCYDYDAVFVLTGGVAAAESHRDLLLTTASSIVAEQNPDGGFAESLKVRPLTSANLAAMLRHCAQADGPARLERARLAAALLRPKNARIHTHWSRYSRQWGESDLWDAWFRMLSLARIEAALDPSAAKRWGFINYPGIGFHPSLRTGDAAR